jgi:hypothetical protein
MKGVHKMRNEASMVGHQPQLLDRDSIIKTTLKYEMYFDSAFLERHNLIFTYLRFVSGHSHAATKGPADHPFFEDSNIYTKSKHGAVSLLDLPRSPS